MVDRTISVNKRGDELYGGTDLVGDLNATRKIRWSKRLVHVTSTGASAVLSMPVNEATASPYGAKGTTFLLWQEGGTNGIPVNNDTDSPSTLGTLGVDEMRELVLIGTDPSSIASWYLGPAQAVTKSAGNRPGGPFLVANYTFDQSHDGGFNIRSWLNSAFGYEGLTPAIVTITIDPGVVVGHTRPNSYPLDTGILPLDSILNIVNNGTISGAGGDGGVGGIVGVNPTDGGFGGTAINIRPPSTAPTNFLTVNFTNNGVIQGGGGGGAGGPFLQVPLHGGGGGGGAGFNAGVGGTATTPALHGQDGTVTTGGAGGAGASSLLYGGVGGGPGQVGGSNAIQSAVGGAAGAYLARTIVGVVMNWVTPGTRYGQEFTS